MNLNVQAILQSVAAALATAIASISLWHSVVITPIHGELTELKMAQKETNKTVRTVEVNQARVAVSIENLAKSIEGLANQIAIERQMNIARKTDSVIFPPVKGVGDVRN